MILHGRGYHRKISFLFSIELFQAVKNRDFLFLQQRCKFGAFVYVWLHYSSYLSLPIHPFIQKLIQKQSPVTTYRHQNDSNCLHVPASSAQGWLMDLTCSPV